MNIDLPEADGRIVRYTLTGTPVEGTPGRFNRVAYAAAHVVADPFRMTNPWETPVVDWDKTLAFRHHLWSLGFRIAEAMDTSQRGMGFDWAKRQGADPPLDCRGEDGRGRRPRLGGRHRPARARRRRHHRRCDRRL